MRFYKLVRFKNKFVTKNFALVTYDNPQCNRLIVIIISLVVLNFQVLLALEEGCLERITCHLDLQMSTALVMNST